MFIWFSVGCGLLCVYRRVFFLASRPYTYTSGFIIISKRFSECWLLGPFS